MVINLAPSPTDEVMVAITSDAQLVQFPITSQSLTPEDIKYSVCSFHGPKPIVSMDLATLKPLIMTCSLDNFTVMEFSEARP